MTCRTTLITVESTITRVTVELSHNLGNPDGVLPTQHLQGVVTTQDTCILEGYEAGQPAQDDKLQTLPDRRLVKMCQTGDYESFHELMRRHHTALLRTEENRSFHFEDN